jgi:hypothetical protein
MPGMSNEMLARQRVQELVRKGEEERRGAGLRPDRPRPKRRLLAALRRRRPVTAIAAIARARSQSR